jgi:ubiquinone/menaquinone biosynthesis C-methylase UbiE
MERTPEPELMDEHEQAAAYAAADWSESHGKIAVYFRERFPKFSGGCVIDLGCGSADVTIRFVKAYPSITAVGVDGSEEMLGFGRRYIREAGLDTRIHLERRYLPDPSLENATFDAAISNSLLHHLSDPMTLWRAATRAVRPGAPVMIIDLLRPSDPQIAARLVAEHASDAPPILQRDFLASLHAAYTADEILRQLIAAELSGFRVDVVDEFHFVVWGHAPTTGPHE